MLLNKAALIILFELFCDFNKSWGKAHSHGHSHGRGSSRRSSSSSTVSIGSISGHGQHTGNSAGRSSTHRKTWSTSSSNEHITSDNSKEITLSTPAYDLFKYSPPEYNFIDYKPVTHEDRKPVHYMPQSLSVQELDNFITGYITGKFGMGSTVTDFSNKSPSDSDNSYINYRYSQQYQPPIVMQPSSENNFKGESKSQEDIFDAKQSENHLKPFSSNFESLNLNMPLPTSSNSLRVHCQQQLHSEFNERGEIVDSVIKICNPLTAVTTTPQPTTTSTTTTTTTAKTLETSSTSAFKPYAVKEKRYERKLNSTQRGINCRKVMKSEFNEHGEIVDSVSEICDPPTTTPTTTRKPTPKTTTRRPTTTRKPLVKVCRRVMDSYLNEAGEIIDSVTDVCTMEPVK